MGNAYARYETSLSQTLGLQYEEENGHIYIRDVKQDETELEEQDTFTMNFVLSNGESEEEYWTYNQEASLSIFATVGLEDPMRYTLVLMDGSVNYTATYSEVKKGSDLYSKYGPGWIYHFYDESGEEIKWQFSGNQFMERQMKVIVTGANTAPTALNFIVHTNPGER